MRWFTCTSRNLPYMRQYTSCVLCKKSRHAKNPLWVAVRMTCLRPLAQAQKACPRGRVLHNAQ